MSTCQGKKCAFPIFYCKTTPHGYSSEPQCFNLQVSRLYEVTENSKSHRIGQEYSLSDADRYFPSAHCLENTRTEKTKLESKKWPQGGIIILVCFVECVWKKNISEQYKK